MKSFKISAILIGLLALSACGNKNGSVTGVDAGLSGQAALNSITRFQVDPRTSFLEWDANSLEDLDFTIASCDDNRCSAIYRVKCRFDRCKVWDRDRGEGFNHLMMVNMVNGERTYRLELCDGGAWDRDDWLEIQAANRDGAGDWVTAQSARLELDPYCTPQQQPPRR